MAYLGRSESNLVTFLPEAEPERSTAADAIAAALAEPVEAGRRRALLIARIDGEEPDRSPLAPSLKKAGFLPGSRGYLKRLGKTVSGKAAQEVELTAES